MPHIQVPPEIPGILALLKQYPQTGATINQFTQALLRAEEGITSAERELIATYVSARNKCRFCTQSHAAAARVLYGPQENVVDAALADMTHAPLSDKMKALLAIAGKVQTDGRSVTSEDIDRARAAGANDRAIHDTVLIAAAFCMFNRYVDGLAATTPDDENFYKKIGQHLVDHGYDKLQSDGEHMSENDE
jgi:uncharacterized peroxidase-related enzyme